MITIDGRDIPPPKQSEPAWRKFKFDGAEFCAATSGIFDGIVRLPGLGFGWHVREVKPNDEDGTVVVIARKATAAEMLAKLEG